MGCLEVRWSSRLISASSLLCGFFSLCLLFFLLTHRKGEISLKWYKVTSEGRARTHTHLTSHASVVLTVKHHQRRTHTRIHTNTHTSLVKHAHPHACVHAQTRTSTTATHSCTCTPCCISAHSPPSIPSQAYFNWKCWRLKNFSFISQCCNWIWGMPPCVCVSAHAPCVFSADSGGSIDSKSKTQLCGFPSRPLCECRSSLSFQARPAHLALLSGAVTQRFNTNSHSSSFSRSNDPSSTPPSRNSPTPNPPPPLKKKNQKIVGYLGKFGGKRPPWPQSRWAEAFVDRHAAEVNADADFDPKECCVLKTASFKRRRSPFPVLCLEW